MPMPSVTTIAAWTGVVLGVINALVTWRKHWWEMGARREERRRREWCKARVNELRQRPGPGLPRRESIEVNEEHHDWARWGARVEGLFLLVPFQNGRLFITLRK